MKGLTVRGLSGSGPSFGIYHDDPTEVPTAELRAHAGHRLAPGKDVPNGFGRVALANGTFPVLTCKGPYSKLPDAWGYPYATARPESGRAFREGLPFERNLTNPRDTSPEDCVTEIEKNERGGSSAPSHLKFRAMQGYRMNISAELEMAS